HGDFERDLGGLEEGVAPQPAGRAREEGRRQAGSHDHLRRSREGVPGTLPADRHEADHEPGDDHEAGDETASGSVVAAKEQEQGEHGCRADDHVGRHLQDQGTVDHVRSSDDRFTSSSSLGTSAPLRLARIRAAAPRATTVRTVISPNVSKARKSVRITLTTLAPPPSGSERVRYSPLSGATSREAAAQRANAPAVIPVRTERISRLTWRSRHWMFSQ